MDKYILPAYRITPDLAKIPTSLLQEAGRKPGNMARLKAEALGSVEIERDVQAFVLPKLRPYAPGPAFDHMIFVAKEGGTIQGIQDLAPTNLARLLNMGGKILQAYERNTGADDPLTKEIMAINYHQNPVDESVFQRKLYAQSLTDLHVHVVGFRTSDVRELSPVKKAALTKNQYLEVHEPLSFFIERLLTIPTIRERVTHGLTILSLDLKREQAYPGISLTSSTMDVSDPTFSADLIQLHRNLASLYADVTRLFADTDRLDAANMPTLFPQSQRDANIRAFFSEHHHVRLMQAFLRLSKHMKSGEGLLSLPANEKMQASIFLRGFAYTLALLREPSNQRLSVNVSPRLLSTGNLLATLGYCKVTGEPPPSAWMVEKKRNEQAIAVALAHA